MADLIKGECVVGAVKGFRTKVNGDYKNHYMAVVHRQFNDGYGDGAQEYIEVEVPNYRSDEVKGFCEKNVGQMVQVPFFSQVRSGVKNGKPWAFNSRRLPKDAQIQVLNAK